MKISNNKIGSPQPNIDAAKTGKSEAAAGLIKDAKVGGPTSKDVKGSANVNVSDRAQMMKQAKEIASRPDTVDEAKVARLQKLIDEGNYKTDANAIADRLVEEHLLIPD